MEEPWENWAKTSGLWVKFVVPKIKTDYEPLYIKHSTWIARILRVYLAYQIYILMAQHKGQLKLFQKC